MSLFERIRDWLTEPVDFFGCRVAPPPEVSNDDLVYLYEWVTYGGHWLVPSRSMATLRLNFYAAPARAFNILRNVLVAR